MPKGGKLTISTDIVQIDKPNCQIQSFTLIPGDFLMITLTDTGIGMSEQIMEKIFEPFFTTKKRGKGTGMGWAAVYGTLKNHKGAIKVTSKKGVGSTFEFYIPLTTSNNFSI